MAEIDARPLFVDNQDGNTLARAIKAHLEALRDAGKTPAELCVTSAYFNPQGLELLARELRHVPRIRLLLGAEPTPEALLPRRRPDDPPEPEFTRRRLRASLGRIEEALRADRNRIPFDLEGDRALRTLLDFLHSGRIEVRRYEGHFLHAKAFLFRGEDRGLLSGSSNLTRAGLQSNLELNLGHWDDPLLERVEAWYDTLWDEAVPFDLAAIYEELLADYPPYLLYLKVLWHLYHDELVEEEAETGHIPVTTFQRHGVWRARKILQSYGGVLIADGVGLGKTYTAGEIIRDYRERRQRVLLVCPASLRDTTWKKFLNDYQLLVECLSYEELARDAQLGGEHHHLKNPLEDYALVVVDEAHYYRNPRRADSGGYPAPSPGRQASRSGAAHRHAGQQLALGPLPRAALLPQTGRGACPPGSTLDSRALRGGHASRPLRPQPRPSLSDHRRDYGQAHTSLRDAPLPGRHDRRSRRAHADPFPAPGGLDEPAGGISTSSSRAKNPGRTSSRS